VSGLTIVAALGVGLVTTGAAAHAAPSAPALPVRAAGPAPTPPDESATPAPAAPGDTRTGGSAPAPGPDRPAWVWLVAVAFGALVVAGGLRIWRLREDPGGDSAYFSTESEPPLDPLRAPH
jgi:hypothetical protein